jgi:hypothetical protein
VTINYVAFEICEDFSFCKKSGSFHLEYWVAGTQPALEVLPVEQMPDKNC